MSSHPDEITRLEAMHAENPDGRVFAHLAEAYRKAGELDRARDVLEQGLQRHPEYASAHVVLGRVHLDQDDTSSADSAFRRVLELDGQNLVALRARADIARAQGRSADAVRYYNDVLAADPGDEHVLRALEALRSEEEAAPEAVEPAEIDAGRLATQTADAADDRFAPENAGTGSRDDSPEPDGAGDPSEVAEPSEPPGPAARPPVTDLGVELEPTDIGAGFGDERAAADAETVGTPEPVETPESIGTPESVETPEFSAPLELPGPPDPAGTSELADAVGPPRSESRGADEERQAPEEPAAMDTQSAAPAGAGPSPESRARSGLPGWSDTGEPVGASEARSRLPHEEVRDAGAPPDGGAARGERPSHEEHTPFAPEPAPPTGVAGAPEADEEAEAVPAPSVGAELVTETIGDLYARQGLHERAVDVYTKLLERRPGDAGLEAKLADARAAVEAGPQQPDAPARPEWSAVEEVQVPPVAEGAVRAELEAEQLSASESDERPDSASEEPEQPDWLEHATRPIESRTDSAPPTDSALPTDSAPPTESAPPPDFAPPPDSAPVMDSGWESASVSEPESGSQADAGAAARQREADAEASAMEARPDEEREQELAGLPSDAWGESPVVEPDELGMEPVDAGTQEETDVLDGLDIGPEVGAQPGPQQPSGVDTSDLGLEPVGGGSDLFADVPPGTAEEAPVEEVEAAWTGGAGHEEPPESPFGWTEVDAADETTEPSIGDHFASILAGSAPESAGPAAGDDSAASTPGDEAAAASAGDEAAGASAARDEAAAAPISGDELAATPTAGDEPAAAAPTGETKPGGAAPVAREMDEIDALFAQTEPSGSEAPRDFGGSQPPTAAPSEPAPSPAGEADAEPSERAEPADLGRPDVVGSPDLEGGAGAGSEMDEIDALFAGATSSEPPQAGAGTREEPAGTAEAEPEPEAPGATAGGGGQEWDPFEALADVGDAGEARAEAATEPADRHTADRPEESAGAAPGPAPEDASSDEDDEDLEMFRAWLQSLKR